LESFASGFAAELTRTGYTPMSVRTQLELAAHLSRWLDSEGLDPAALTSPVVDAFLVARRACYRTLRSPKAMEPVLSYLRHLGVALAVTADPASMPVDVLVERFRSYLLAERGLTIAATRGYVDLIRPFIAACARATGADLDAPTPGEVASFMVSESHRLAPKTVQRLASALRSLLRFGMWTVFLQCRWRRRCPRSPTGGPPYRKRCNRRRSMPCWLHVTYEVLLDFGIRDADTAIPDGVAVRGGRRAATWPVPSVLSWMPCSASRVVTTRTRCCAPRRSGVQTPKSSVRAHYGSGSAADQVTRELRCPRARQGGRVIPWTS
jgi:hypothetical protein